MAIRIGLSGWNYPGRRGRFYPAGMRWLKPATGPGASAGSGVEAALEVEPRDVLAVSRDHALAPISKAQQESGDDEAPLATALRISRRDARFERLLKLAAVAPRP